jgi:hypothetical protein
MKEHIKDIRTLLKKLERNVKIREENGRMVNANLKTMKK